MRADGFTPAWEVKARKWGPRYPSGLELESGKLTGFGVRRQGDAPLISAQNSLSFALLLHQAGETTSSASQDWALN